MPLRLIVLFCLSFALLSVQAQPEWLNSPTETNLEPKKPPAPPTLSLGFDWPNELRAQGALFWAPAWQASLHATLEKRKGVDGLNAISGIGLHILRIWFDESNEHPLENSEFLFAAFNLHHNYQESLGHLRPQLGLGLGKYWKPFDNIPLGLDLQVELSRVFFGVLRPEADSYEVQKTRLRFGALLFHPFD